MSWKRDFGFLVLTLFAILSYFFLALGFGIFQRYPLLHIFLAVAGCAGLAWGLLQEFRLRRLVFLLFAGILTAGYIWYTLSYSTYPTTEIEVAEGSVIEGLAELELASHRNLLKPVLAPPEEAAATLVVFYRGFW
jgi:hypothetical protein